MDKFMMTATLAAICAFLAAAAVGPIFIPILTRLKFGQQIREIGPGWHKKKSGTPTMGGVIFIIGALVACVVFARVPEAMFLLCGALAFGLIGFADDFIKVVMKRNLGLKSLQKFALQVAVAAVFVQLGIYFKFFDTTVIMPFTKNVVDLRFLYLPLAVFVLVGGTNAVNLTDGLDGLAASVTAVVAVFFTVCAYALGKLPEAVFAAAITGGCMGFLLFNSHPAKVFMGDTGSLFLGGAVCMTALMLKLPIILIAAGGVYVLETLSVIIQVAYFKKTGKRIFKMSPIHHHFELLGYSERKIVTGAIIISFVCCAAAYLLAF